MIFIVLLIFFSNLLMAKENCSLHKNNLNTDPNLIEIFDDINCSELSIGQTKLVNYEHSESPTSLEHKYIIERVGTNEYKLKLNLKFQENTLWPMENSELDKTIRRNINNCLDEINPRLKGPDNVSLNIEILEPNSENKKKYKKIESVITVSDTPVKREHSHFYSLQSSCPVIIHELLHLMGLVDEYTEITNIPFYKQVVEQSDQ